MSKNIADVYKQDNKQLIIIISGLSGTGKSVLGENISRDFKLHRLDTKNFYKSGFNETIKLPNDTVVVNYDSDNAIDWDKLNDEINNAKTNGVVVIGNVFPTDKLKFAPDYHIHLKLPKQELRKKLLEYIEKHPEKGFDITTESLRINSATYPYYLDSLKKMKMDKFVDVSNMSNDDIYDIVFDSIIEFIKNNVYHMSDTKHSKISSDNISRNDMSSDQMSEISDTLYYGNDYIISYKDNDD